MWAEDPLQVWTGVRWNARRNGKPRFGVAVSDRSLALAARVKNHAPREVKRLGQGTKVVATVKKNRRGGGGFEPQPICLSTIENAVFAYPNLSPNLTESQACRRVADRPERSIPTNGQPTDFILRVSGSRDTGHLAGERHKQSLDFARTAFMDAPFFVFISSCGVPHGMPTTRLMFLLSRSSRVPNSGRCQCQRPGTPRGDNYQIK